GVVLFDLQRQGTSNSECNRCARLKKESVSAGLSELELAAKVQWVNHGEIVSFLWGVADLIRDTFKRGKYQDVILPLTVLRRLDCVLAERKEKVLGKQAE